MLSLEDTYFELARKRGQRAVIVCDRGALDSSACMCNGRRSPSYLVGLSVADIDRDTWLRILHDCGLNELELRDGRYDCVVHLLTAAQGAEKFYTLRNNTTRTEGIQQAREIDDRILNAWLGHPYLEIIDNSTNFEDKMNRVVEAICRRLGVEDSRGRFLAKRKFLLRTMPDNACFTCRYQDFDVVHSYLLSSGESQARIRKRGQHGAVPFIYGD